MKRNVILSLLGVAALTAMVSCASEPKKTVSLVGHKAVVVTYDQAISAASVTPETFTVNGKAPKVVFVTDQDPAELLKKVGECDHHHHHGGPAPEGVKPGEKPQGPAPEGVKPGEAPKAPEAKPGEKPQGPAPEGVKPGEAPKGPAPKEFKPESKDGKYVVLLLVDGKPHACPPDAQCCKEGADSTKKDVKPGQPAPGAPAPAAKPDEAPKAPEAKPGEKPAPAAKPEPLPKELNVQQVKDIKTAAGKAVKAWKAAEKVAVPEMPAAKPAPAPGPAPAAKPGEAPKAPEAKPEEKK